MTPSPILSSGPFLCVIFLENVIVLCVVVCIAFWSPKECFRHTRARSARCLHRSYEFLHNSCRRPWSSSLAVHLVPIPLGNPGTGPRRNDTRGIGFAKRGTPVETPLPKLGMRGRSGAFLLHWPWHHSTSLSVAFSHTFHPRVAPDDFISSICLLTFENGPASTSSHIRLATTSCIFNVKVTLAGGPTFLA